MLPEYVTVQLLQSKPLESFLPTMTILLIYRLTRILQVFNQHVAEEKVALFSDNRSKYQIALVEPASR